MESLTSNVSYVLVKQYVMRFWGALMVVLGIFGNPNPDIGTPAGILLRVALILVGILSVKYSFRFMFIQYNQSSFGLGDTGLKYSDIENLQAFGRFLFVKVRGKWFFTIGQVGFFEQVREIDEFIEIANSWQREKT